MRKTENHAQAAKAKEDNVIHIVYKEEGYCITTEANLFWAHRYEIIFSCTSSLLRTLSYVVYKFLQNIPGERAEIGMYGYF